MHGVVATTMHCLRWEQFAKDPLETPQRYLLSLHKDLSFSPCLNTYMLGLVGLGWAEMGWTRRRQGLGLGLGLGQRPGLGAGLWADPVLKKQEEAVATLAQPLAPVLAPQRTLVRKGAGLH